MSDESLEAKARGDADADADGAPVEPLRPRTSLPSFVPRSAEEGLDVALDALQPSLLPPAVPREPSLTPAPDEEARADEGLADVADADADADA